MSNRHEVGILELMHSLKMVGWITFVFFCGFDWIFHQPVDVLILIAGLFTYGIMANN